MDYDPALPSWSILTKSHGGTVSVIRDLTLEQARQIYERLDPWYGQVSFENEGSSMGLHNGTIELRQVFGPPGWPPDMVHEWNGMAASGDPGRAGRTRHAEQDDARTAP